MDLNNCEKNKANDTLSGPFQFAKKLLSDFKQSSLVDELETPATKIQKLSSVNYIKSKDKFVEENIVPFQKPIVEEATISKPKVSLPREVKKNKKLLNSAEKAIKAKHDSYMEQMAKFKHYVDICLQMGSMTSLVPEMEKLSQWQCQIMKKLEDKCEERNVMMQMLIQNQVLEKSHEDEVMDAQLKAEIKSLQEKNTNTIHALTEVARDMNYRSERDHQITTKQEFFTKFEQIQAKIASAMAELKQEEDCVASTVANDKKFWDSKLVNFEKSLQESDKKKDREIGELERKIKLKKCDMGELEVYSLDETTEFCDLDETAEFV